MVAPAEDEGVVRVLKNLLQFRRVEGEAAVEILAEERVALDCVGRTAAVVDEEWSGLWIRHA